MRNKSSISLLAYRGFSALRKRIIGHILPTDCRGFSMIETFVAITILTLAITGPLTLASKGLSSAYLAQDQVTAFYLAQDTMEILHYWRDSDSLKGNAFGDFFIDEGVPSCLNSPGGTTRCYTDATAFEFAQCSGTCPKLYYYPQLRTYGSLSNNLFSDEVETKFTRYFVAEQLNGNEIAVSVTVEWETGIFTRSLTINENLFNWQ